MTNEIHSALGDAIVGFQLWIHRRVESVHFHSGERGTRRVSLDCTPPPDPRLAENEDERQLYSVEDVRGSMILPIALMSKAPLRNFDLVDSAGMPIPILTRDQTAPLVVGAVFDLLQRQSVVLSKVCKDALQEIVEGDPISAAHVAKTLVHTGLYQKVLVVDVEKADAIVKRLIENLASNFVMLCAIPSASAGVRTILKWSNNWHIDPTEIDWTFRLRTALGYDYVELRLPIAGAEDTNSYHLEVNLPEDLGSAGLQLPSSPDSTSMVVSDITQNPIAHAHARYGPLPAADATLFVVVPWAGKRFQSALASLATTIILGLIILLPNGRGALLDSRDGAAAILLVAPVVLMTLAASNRENVTSQRLVAPLRVIMFACATILGLVAASIVGGLQSPWIDFFWWGSFFGSAALTSIFWLYPRNRRRSMVERSEVRGVE